MLLKSPGYTAIAILTLALGIAANTAVFTVANAVLLRPLPYAQPDRLITVVGSEPAGGPQWPTLSFPLFGMIQDGNRSFSGFSACIYESFNMTGHGEPEQIRGARATANLFDVLGVHPVAGRTFLPEEDQPGARQVVILSNELASRLFGDAHAALNRTLTLDSRDYTIVGVLPSGFVFTLFGPRRDIWAPRVFDMSFVTPARVARGGPYFNFIGRLRPGVSRQQAASELNMRYQNYRQDRPGNFDATLNLSLHAERLQDQLVAGVRPALLALAVTVICVLLIACGNVASLLLSRALGRRKEFAVRLALGAPRSALIRQLLIESLLVALASGGLGIALAQAGTHVLIALNPDGLQASELTLNPEVLLFTVAISICSGVLFGLAPALQLSRTDMHTGLREEGRGVSGTRRGHRARSLLVVAQVALSMVLLIGSGLLIRNFLQMRNASPGFDPSNTLTMQMTLPSGKYPQPASMITFYRGVLERVKNLPGVQAVSISTALPVTPTHLTPVLFEGQPAVAIGKRPIVNLQQISPDYAKVMRIPLISGRTFNDRDDAQSAPVAIVNRLAVRQFWPSQNPIGKKIWVGTLPSAYEVVGVIGETRNNGLAAAALPEIMLPYPQMTVPYLSLSVRTAANPRGMVMDVKREIAAVDRDQPVTEIKTMDELMDSLSEGARFTMLLISVLSGAAFVLAAVGIYSVVAYSAGQRTPELGIRIALGASDADILRLVIRGGLLLAVSGIAIGIAGALALTRIMSTLLYETSAVDPATYLLCAMIFVLVALLASYFPARRATRIDPAEALRAE
jgi:putative ABC transport system permease protein